MTDQTQSQQRIPSSPLRRHSFEGGETTVLARYAKLVPGDPDRLFTFAAREVEARGLEIIPPWKHDDDSDWSELRAYYCGDDRNIIVYFLENWADEAVTGFTSCFPIIELHELTHWAIPQEDNEQDPDHWTRWNRVLTEAVSYVMGIDEWDVREFEPPEAKTTSSQGSAGRQATLEDVMTS